MNISENKLRDIIQESIDKVARFGNNPIGIALRIEEDPPDRPSDEEIEKWCLRGFAAYYLIRKHYLEWYWDCQVANNLPRALPYKGKVNGWVLTEHPYILEEKDPKYMAQLMPYITQILEDG